MHASKQAKMNRCASKWHIILQASMLCIRELPFNTAIHIQLLLCVSNGATCKCRLEL